MKYTIYIFLFFILVNIAISQNETLNWIFGNYTGITFNTSDGEPKSLDNVKFYSFEGCASISDSLGNLLFYTNGSNIYDNKGKIININNKMLGDFHSTQSAIIIKLPENQNIYYIFTTDAGLYADSINEGLNLTIVKSDLQSTEIIEINRLIHKNSTEKLTACYHKNGRDVWVISRESNSNSFISNLLTKNGIEKSVRSNVGNIQIGDSNLVIGYMKCSPRGDKIATTCVTNNYAEIFKFDNENGVVNSPISIDMGNRVANYGLEFSPSGKFLYICDANEGLISQFNVNEFDKNKIQNSEKIIAKEKDDLGAMQLAPNGKIYIANLNSPYLSEIQFPDKEGDNCNYISKSFSINGYPEKFCSYGLPNFNTGYFDFSLLIELNEFCINQNINLKLKRFPNFKNTKYSWKGPNNFKSNSRELNLINAQKINEGWYYLLAEYLNFSVNDSIYIKILDAPNAKIVKQGDFSTDGFIILKAEKDENVSSIKWSTDEISDEIKVGKPGKYFLYAYNSIGCYSIDSIEIAILKDAIKFLKYDSLLFNEICFGGSDIKDIKIENVGNQSILINDITFDNSNSEFQVLNKNQIVGSINPNAQKLIRIRFYSGVPGDFKKNLQINTGFGNEKQIYQSEIVGLAKAELKVWIPYIKDEAGKRVRIPIYAKLECYEGLTLNADLNFNIKFHKDVYFPDKVINAISTKKLVQDTFLINIDLRNIKLTDKQQEITSLDGWMFTGNFAPDSIYFSDFHINYDNVFVELINGSLEVTGCADELRPVKMIEETTLIIAPNPVKEEAIFKIQTKEKGTFKLYIYSIEGILIEELQFSSNNDDIYDEIIKKINVNNYSSGLYSLILESPTKKIIKQFVVM